jgi:hypothetical protein
VGFFPSLCLSLSLSSSLLVSLSLRSEATPLDTFPLYKRHQSFVYPTPPPTPPLKCDDQCGGKAVTRQTDVPDGAEVDGPHYNSTSFEDCCEKCKANPKCGSFVRGPFSAADPRVTCFLLGNKSPKLVHKATRDFGCVRSLGQA